MGFNRNRRISPDTAYAVRVEDGVVADERHVFQLRLGDQHPVEGIAMRPWKAAGAQRVRDRDRKVLKVLLAQDGRQIGDHIDGADTDRAAPWLRSPTHWRR